MRAATLIVLSLVVASCGGNTGAQPSSPGSSDGDAAPASGGAAQTKLQGTWEITRYESEEPIPPEAMPLMGELFDTLRLTVKGDNVVVDAKSSPFAAKDENDGSFRLATAGGMFDGALCHFVSDNEIEIDDRGTNWPGKSTLKRAR